MNIQDKTGGEIHPTEEASRPRIRVGITHGDINGVGYELIFKTFAEPDIFDLCIPVVYGAAKVAAYHRKALGSQTSFQVIESAEKAQVGRLNLISCTDEEVKTEFGSASAEAGGVAYKALEAAVADMKAGKIDVLVTCPINKATIQSASFRFPGHTEYLADRLGNGAEPLMILMNGRLRVALVTTHLALRQVAEAVTADAIERKLRLFHQSLRRDFLLPMPRIAVLGLNPHNGDHGAIGVEEDEVISPVIRKMTDEGLHVYGPYSADGFFGSGVYKHFDGVLAMYHDQGLAPFKALSMDDGVNFTAGLPYVRTSPDHGTAYDIAGQGVATEHSFRQALYAAIDIFRHRQMDDEARRDPLPQLYKDRREDGERPRRFNRERSLGAEVPGTSKPAVAEKASTEGDV